METLIGLVLLIGSIVGLIKFNKTSASMASGAEAKAQAWAEEIHADVAIDRAGRAKQFKEDTKDLELISHDDFMLMMIGKK